MTSPTGTGTVGAMSDAPPTAARAERHRLADLFLEVGPDAPTLSGSWTTRDLAAHLVVRERRPDAAGGIIFSALARRTEKVQNDIAERPWEQLVETVRSGPPAWSPQRIDALDRATNTIEFFVHHEDVRRAGDSWTPRELPEDLRRDLSTSLRRIAKLLKRQVPDGAKLVPTDGGEPIVLKQAEPLVTVTGPIGELVLFCYGRQAHAKVELTGQVDAIDRLCTASLGV
jgi:uncharacterized protein (TIGR03085 family)